MQIPVYNQNGQKASTIELSGKVFGVPSKGPVLHLAVVAQQANARKAIAHTKMRGEVRGGGKKPWKQKGTGRARQGSIRSPQWRGGGIVFGPRSTRNFSKKLNKKTRHLALVMALSEKVSSEHLFVLDALNPSAHKTKAVANILGALPLKKGSALLALPAAQKEVGVLAKNVNRVMPIWVGSLNVVDIMKHTNLVTTVEGIKELEKIYGTK